jgi:phosphatidylglycerophosphatase C
VDTGRGVAAFDVDGTLTPGDTLLPFLTAVCGRVPTITAMTIESPRFAGMALGRRSRDDVKERLVRRLLRGRDAATVRSAGDRYAATVVDRIRPEMRERVAWHRSRGHEVVLVSASLDVYLTEVARRLDAALLCTRLEVGADGRLTGAFDGPNCRADEKRCRLEEWLAPHDGPKATVWAYGNSGGDEAMLAMADHPVRVKRGRLALIP